MPRPYGDIITFYSYKGGTGRSMVLANVGYLLAASRDYGEPRVLLIDWDLEAPGLERFFEASPSPGPGLIDYFSDMEEHYLREAGDARLPESMARDPDAVEIFESGTRIYPLKKYYKAIDGRPNLFLMRAGFRLPAGSGDPAGYWEKVRKFDWDRFYHYYGSFFTHLRQVLMEDFDYVLIDSRTGLTDIGGICTRVMPEKLVLVFAPNHQNIDGVTDVAEKSIRYRRASRDPRGLMVFPVASRIDASASALRITWRAGGVIRGEKITGYQERFEKLLRDAYRLDECDLGDFLDATQIPHDSDYAYGEAIAAAIDGTQDRFGIGYACEQLTQRLTRLAAPWEALDEQPGEDQGSVFISYRRTDSAAAGRLYDDLTARLGRGRIFMDVGSVAIGEDWRIAIEAQLSAVAAVVVLIGRNWISPGWNSSSDSAGEAVGSPDFVQEEVATALRHELRVIPVLLDDAEMPALAQLPADLQLLAHRQALSLRSSSWHRDVDRLASALISVTGPPQDRPDLSLPPPGSEVPARSPAPAPQGEGTPPQLRQTEDEPAGGQSGWARIVRWFRSLFKPAA